MLTQEDIEMKMYTEGVERSNALFATAEEKGRASETPYAQRLFREYVLPLADILTEKVGQSKPGKRAAYARLLVPLDLHTVAFLAVRHVMNALLGPRPTDHRRLGYSLGRTIHRELVLAQIEEAMPELYHTLARDFNRRVSSDERHRMTVYQMQAKAAGVKWNEWTKGSRDQVGLYLLGRLEDIGLVEIGPLKRDGYKHEYRQVHLSPAVQAVVSSVKQYLAETSPAFGPCVERPIPWKGLTGGGFHTPALRRVHRSLVKVLPTARSLLLGRSMPVVLDAVNLLQDTGWAVNKKVLDVVLALADLDREVAGVCIPFAVPKPERLPFMDTTEKEHLTPEQTEQLTAWKRETAKWWEHKKLRANDFGRFYSCTRQAVQFMENASIYFVYFSDSRGRLYPMTSGLSSQGADMQRALIHFDVGLPVHTEDAEKWFLVLGANKYGYDSAPLADRVAWVHERHDQIMAYANAPLDDMSWTQADKPLQFLAWCFEYKQWKEDPGFVSRLPVGLDGSCSGLQHFSAMFRDEVGGEAVNLTPSNKKQDIYQRVADAAMRRMVADISEDTDGYRATWINHGIGRSVVKRPVMTTPYGITKPSAVKYVISDYLTQDPPPIPGLDRQQLRPLARALMVHAWPAIGDVVVKARLAMDWLRKGSKTIMDKQLSLGAADPVIAWETPSGFLATQCYFEFKLHQVRSHLHGEVRIRVGQETDTPDANRHASGMAPNFVHSMDAAHLHMVAAACGKAGIKHLALIHDDFGTHAANTEKMYHIVREQFYRMYTDHDPVASMAEKYPEMGTPPDRGQLDLSGVLTSEYAFS